MSRKNMNGSHLEEPLVVGAFTVQPKILGRGAWSVVHCAVDNRSGAEVVAKVISKAKLKEKGTFSPGEELREVVIMRMLPSHRNLVRLFEMVETEKHYYIFLEKLPHGDLCDYILKAPNGRLPEAQCRKYLRQIISGLSLLHSIGIAHRDVKPENMLLDPQDVVKITDFGLAKRHTKSRNHVSDPSEMSKELVGTLRYAAPEMFMSHFRGNSYDSFTSDIWSVGVCLYIMFSGSFPFSAGPSADEKQTWDVLQSSELVIPTDVSRDGIDLLKRLLCKDPKNRIKLQEIEGHAWMKGHTTPSSPPRDVSSLPTSSSDLQDTVDGLQVELARYKDMVRNLSEELNKERTLREKLERQLAAADHSASPLLTPPTKAARPAVPVTRTASPQRLPASMSTPVRPATPTYNQGRPTNSPKRVAVAPRAAPSPIRKDPRTASPNRVVTPTSGAKATQLQRSSPVARFGTPMAKPPTVVAPPPPTSPSSGAADGWDLQVNQTVKYKGSVATVRFLGTTGFAEGIWIGLELVEASGLNDGSCFIDKKRYFTCPQGHGVFVRRSQVTL